MLLNKDLIWRPPFCIAYFIYFNITGCNRTGRISQSRGNLCRTNCYRSFRSPGLYCTFRGFMYISGFDCTFRGFVVHFGVLLYISGFCCTFRGYIVHFRVLLYISGVDCTFRGFVVHFGVLLYISGFYCTFRGYIVHLLIYCPYSHNILYSVHLLSYRPYSHSTRQWYVLLTSGVS